MHPIPFPYRGPPAGRLSRRSGSQSTLSVSSTINPFRFPFNLIKLVKKAFSFISGHVFAAVDLAVKRPASAGRHRSLLKPSASGLGDDSGLDRHSGAVDGSDAARRSDLLQVNLKPNVTLRSTYGFESGLTIPCCGGRKGHCRDRHHSKTQCQ